MDVTPQILQHHRIYGASDNTNQGYVASSRALNYGKGPSIQRPENEKVTTIPRVLSFKDTVGLFGTENHFVRVSMNISNPILGCYSEPGWECARFSEEINVNQDPYTYPNNGYSRPGRAYIDYDGDWRNDGSCGSGIVCENTYEPADIIGNNIPNLASKYFRIELKNLKTGNIYIDNWLDVRLYNRAYDEHPYDVMYVKNHEPFYIGFHARNTKRLPYNIECIVGEINEENLLDSVLEIQDIDPRLLATKR